MICVVLGEGVEKPVGGGDRQASVVSVSHSAWCWITSQTQRSTDQQYQSSSQTSCRRTAAGSEDCRWPGWVRADWSSHISNQSCVYKVKVTIQRS